MRNSHVVEEWRNEGRVEACRENLLALLEKQFGPLPEEWVKRIQSLRDAKRLQAALQQVVDIRSLDELQL